MRLIKIIILVTLLPACKNSFFRGSSDAKKSKNGYLNNKEAFSSPSSKDGIIMQPTLDNVNIPVQRVCSKNWAEQAKATLKTVNGVKVFVTEDNSANYFEAKESPTQLRDQMMTQGSFSVALPINSNGYMFVCDAASAICANTVKTPGDKRNTSIIFDGMLAFSSYKAIANGKYTPQTPMEVLVDSSTFFNNIFNKRENCDESHSPLIIDFGDKGIVLSSPSEGVLFDMDGNPGKEKISWPVGKDAYFLALDRNNNSNIDDIHELFGNNTVGEDGNKADNGFLALAKYDANSSGSITSDDPIFAKLLLWQDANRDGSAEPSELKSLSDMRISHIDLDYIEIYDVDAWGNITRQRSTVTLSGAGAEQTEFRMIYDVWFRKSMAL